MTRKSTRPATLVYAHNFCRVTHVDGMQVALAYDLDCERWPWLSLPAHHPVLVEKYQYFSAVTAGWAALDQAAEVHSALTQLSWRCGPASFTGAHATQGLCKLWQNQRDMGYELTTRTDEGRTIAHYTGTGFAFADRDFKAWRAKARQAALEQAKQREIALADPVAVGLDAAGVSFVSPPIDLDGQPAVHARVTTGNGFHPAHPFHTGSGDHVNAGHLLDCALQAAHLLLDATGPLRCTGGRAEFRRFVELDVPFSISLRRRQDGEEPDTELEFLFSQLGRENAVIMLRMNRG